MNLSKKSTYVLLVVILLIGAIGFYFSISSSGSTKETIQESGNRNIKTITIGTISEDAVEGINLTKPTADYIAAKLSNNETRYEGRVVIVNTVDNMTELLKEQKLDLYLESPFTALLVAKKSGSVPFLRRWKQGVPEYHSVFIVKKDSSIRTLNDFTGKTIASEDPASTSGYLLPKVYLMQKGFYVNRSPGKKYVEFVFSGDDKNTPIWVIEGKSDIGAINNMDFEKLPQSIKDKVKVIDRTINVPRHVVSYRSGMDAALVERIKQILLDMDKDPQGIEILKNFEETKKYDELSTEEMLNISKMVDLLE